MSPRGARAAAALTAARAARVPQRKSLYSLAILNMPFLEISQYSRCQIFQQWRNPTRICKMPPNTIRHLLVWKMMPCIIQPRCKSQCIILIHARPSKCDFGMCLPANPRRILLSIWCVSLNCHKQVSQLSAIDCVGETNCLIHLAASIMSSYVQAKALQTK